MDDCELHTLKTASISLPVDPSTDHRRGLPVLPLIPIAYMPSPLPRQVRRNPFARTVPSSSAFPVLWAGRPLHCAFRGLLSVYSHYGLHARRVAIATLYTEGSNDFVASAVASIATGWNEPVPGRVYLPLWISAFHGAP